MRNLLAHVFFVASVNPLLFGDQIAFKNGDRLTSAGNIRPLCRLPGPWVFGEAHHAGQIQKQFGLKTLLPGLGEFIEF